MRETGGAIRRPLDLLDVGTQRIRRPKSAGDHVAIAANRGEQIVEVVRDAAGEPAHRLHLERLMQLLLAVAERFFGGDAFGDVARIDDDAVDRGVIEHVVARTLERHPAIVLDLHASHDGTQRLRRSRDLGEGGRGSLAIVGMDQVEQRSAEKLQRVLSEQPRSRRTDVRHRPAFIDDHDQIATELRDRPEQLFLVTERRLVGGAVHGRREHVGRGLEKGDVLGSELVGRAVHHHQRPERPMPPANRNGGRAARVGLVNRRRRSISILAREVRGHHRLRGADDILRNRAFGVDHPADRIDVLAADVRSDDLLPLVAQLHHVDKVDDQRRLHELDGVGEEVFDRNAGDCAQAKRRRRRLLPLAQRQHRDVAEVDGDGVGDPARTASRGSCRPARTARERPWARPPRMRRRGRCRSATAPTRERGRETIHPRTPPMGRIAGRPPR